MIDGKFAWAFTVGMLATVNPCGFAMLPAYLSFFLGTEAREGDARPTGVRLARALVVSGAVCAGFVVVFAALGLAGATVTERFADWARYLTIVIGLALAALGIAMLAGWRIALALPKLERGGERRSIGSMFLFGVSYAVASLGCSIPLFLAAVVGTFTRESFVSGVTTVLLYGLGMGLVLTALTVTLALAQGGLLRVLRRAMRHLDRVAGAVLVLSGAYLVYYWLYNLTTDYGATATRGDGVIERVDRWSASAGEWILAQGAWTMGLVLGAVVVAAAAVVAITRRRATTR